ncbi:MAG: hypothetical protein M3445_08635 [Actinomycetota bacterium]|nr:hypothetical protein [Actinomycetota bacterium]
MAEQKSKAEGVTTRDDATDLGVPMLAGDVSEPTGPEDALGVGKKRGDYADRVGPSNYQPHESVRVVDAKPGEATVVLQAQRPRVEERGDEKGKKGGVDAA